MNHLRKALHTVGDTLSPKTSSSNSTSAGSLSGCILIQGGTVTVAQRKVKVGDKVWGGGRAPGIDYPTVDYPHPTPPDSRLPNS
jgi:hypothetical protein